MNVSKKMAEWRGKQPQNFKSPILEQLASLIKHTSDDYGERSIVKGKAYIITCGKWRDENDGNK